MATYPRRQRDPHLGSDILGNSVQHGARGKLRCIQHGLQRVPGWSLMEGHSRPKTHSRPGSRFCAREPSYHCYSHDSRLCRPCWRGIYHEGHISLRFMMTIASFEKRLEFGLKPSIRRQKVFTNPKSPHSYHLPRFTYFMNTMIRSKLSSHYSSAIITQRGW